MYVCFLIINGLWLNAAQIMKFDQYRNCEKDRCRSYTRVWMNNREYMTFDNTQISHESFIRKINGCAASAE